jgi:tetratricopeptide (TPR) repeat protein
VERPARRQDDAPPRIAIDGTDYERFRAAELWERIHWLPFEEQKRHLRGYLFRSTVLFDLLRKTSREEGRKDRKRGIRIAELALVSLERHDDVFGDRIHDLRALGWAWLANARVVALDLETAEADFACAEQEWSVPRVEKNLEVLAQIKVLKGGLRMFQRCYPDALELLNESIQLARLTGNAAIDAEALIQRASVKDYMNCLRESAEDLQCAANLIEGEKEPYLAFSVCMNQANVHLKLGDHASGVACQAEAATWCQRIDSRLGWHQVQYLQGALHELAGDSVPAEGSYLEALEGFIFFGELRSAALVALDLGILYAQQGKRSRALELAAWATPILQSTKLHEETLAAIELLAHELEAMRVDRSLLCRVAKLLELDPLTRLGPETRAGRTITRPSCLPG